MCIKPLLPRQVLKDIILIYKPSLEETLGRPIGLMLTRCGVFPGEIKSKPCEWIKWIRDVWAMYGLPVGASVEGELHLSWMQMFPSPFMPFVFILLLFLQEAG
jgi:hypothetical protein